MIKIVITMDLKKTSFSVCTFYEIPVRALYVQGKVIGNEDLFM